MTGNTGLRKGKQSELYNYPYIMSCRNFQTVEQEGRTRMWSVNFID